MSAPNFCLRNANRYFIAPEPEEEYSEFFYDDLKEDATYVAKEHGFEGIGGDMYKQYLREVEGKSNGAYNDYYATALPCSFECSRTDKYDGSWECELIPLIRSGYYAGANLDFYIKIIDPTGEHMENVDALNGAVHEDVINDYLHYLEDYEDQELDGSDAYAMKEIVDDLIEQATSKFYEFAEATGWDEYARAGLFSNGEAIYTNLSEIKRKAGRK